MTNTNVIEKGMKARFEEAQKIESFVKGQAFEDYVRAEIFTKEYYAQVERTHGYEMNSKDFVESSLNPDFKLRDLATKKEFWLEVKFRRLVRKGRVKWCKEYQLRRYLSFSKETPMFILLGVGGNPEAPAAVYLIPMEQVKFSSLFITTLKRYEISRGQSITSRLLWYR